MPTPTPIEAILARFDENVREAYDRIKKWRA